MKIDILEKFVQLQISYLLQYSGPLGIIFNLKIE